MTSNKSIKERFFQSCIDGNLDTIKTDLFYNVSPFIQDKYGNNALHLSCMNNQPKILEYVLKNTKTFKSDVQNKCGRSALSIAASQGSFECIEILLNNLNCDINSTDKNFKNTPLHWCVTSKCVKGVEILLNHGADFMMVNKFGKTPMQLAKTTCLNIYHLIEQTIKTKTKDQYLQTTSQTNISFETKPNNSIESTKFKNTDRTTKTNSKRFEKIINNQNVNNETPYKQPNLTYNNINESFFLNISGLKHGDNSVLKLLEKSIEPVDETSFVSSILNSGKVIQLTEAGILALEYTKNEVNTPIPNSLVKSFLTTSQHFNETENHSSNITTEKYNELDYKSPSKGIKRLKSPLPCSKRFKYNETNTKKMSEFENLLEQLSSKCTKTVAKVNDPSLYCSQNSSTVENNGGNNNEVCNKNQLMCLSSDINAQPKWVEDIMCLLHKLETSDVVEHKTFE